MCTVHRQTLCGLLCGKSKGRDLGCNWCLESFQYWKKLPTYHVEVVNDLNDLMQSFIFIVFQLF